MPSMQRIVEIIRYKAQKNASTTTKHTHCGLVMPFPGENRGVKGTGKRSKSYLTASREHYLQGTSVAIGWLGKKEFFSYYQSLASAWVIFFLFFVLIN